MIVLKISLIQFGINQGSFRILMPHKLLKVLKRDAAAQASGGEGVPETMGEDVHS